MTAPHRSWHDPCRGGGVALHAMNAFLSLLTVGLLAAPLAHAQDDPRSKAVMDRLVAKNKGYTSFEADFTSRLVNKAGKLDVKQEGTVKVKGKKFHLVLDKNTVISDGVTLWTYNKEANEVSLNAAAEMDQELDPSKLFTMYETGFKSQFVSEAPDAAGVVLQTVKLFPTDPTKRAYHTVVLVVDKAKVEPRSVQVLYKDGNEVTYSLKRFVPNVDLADAVFVFDKGKHPGVEVNDLR